MKYVHRRCLNQWRIVSPNNESFYQCDVCQYRYQIQDVAVGEKVDCCPPSVKFFSFISLDIGIILLLWQILVFLNVGFVYLVDWNRSRDQISIFQGWPQFAIDYFSGLTFFFFFLGLFAIFIGFCKLFMYLLKADSCCDDGKYSHNTYHYSNRYDMLDWFFLWYWWSIWSPNRVVFIHSSPVCFCPSDPLCIPDCNSADCNFGGCGGGGGDGKDAIAVILVILVIIFVIIVLIGVIIGMLMFFKIVYDITIKRMAILERKNLIIEKVVIDLGENPTF